MSLTVCASYWSYMELEDGNPQWVPEEFVWKIANPWHYNLNPVRVQCPNFALEWTFFKKDKVDEETDTQGSESFPFLPLTCESLLIKHRLATSRKLEVIAYPRKTKTTKLRWTLVLAGKPRDTRRIGPILLDSELCHIRIINIYLSALIEFQFSVEIYIVVPVENMQRND